MKTRRRLVLAVCVSMCAGASSLGGQCVDSAGRGGAGRLILLGGTADRRLRTLEDVGACPTGGSLIRTTSSLSSQLADSGFDWSPISPILRTTSNSAIPFSMNDGALWAGRGLSADVTAGLTAHYRVVTLTLAPQFLWEQNRDFFVLPSDAADRSPYASPWHSGPESADLPLRFGSQPIRMVDLGQSRVDLSLGRVSAGLTTEDQWWGPGVQNAIVMSDNAAGIPEVYLRTRAPLHTRLGDVEARWIVGGLSESMYFDSSSQDNLRSLSGAVATLRTAIDTGLTIGIARTVYRPAGNVSDIATHGLDVFTRWGQTGAAPTRDDSRSISRGDAMFSLFGRWVFPESGVEIYGEWARLVLPTSFRELLLDPQRTQGYTVGFQWVSKPTLVHALRLASEFTMLEQTPPTKGAFIPSYYVSAVTPQGYTQRGQVIGAAIGPGSSSQWLAADYLARGWTLGLEAGRVRWEDEAYYRQLVSIGHFAHDVTVYGGARASGRIFGVPLSAELTRGTRLNYLFQSAVSGYVQNGNFDIHNTTLRLSVGGG